MRVCAWHAGSGRSIPDIKQAPYNVPTATFARLSTHITTQFAATDRHPRDGTPCAHIIHTLLQPASQLTPNPAIVGAGPVFSTGWWAHGAPSKRHFLHAKPKAHMNVVTTKELQSHVKTANMHVRSVNNHQQTSKNKKRVWDTWCTRSKAYVVFEPVSTTNSCKAVSSGERMGLRGVLRGWRPSQARSCHRCRQRRSCVRPPHSLGRHCRSCRTHCGQHTSTTRGMS